MRGRLIEKAMRVRVGIANGPERREDVIDALRGREWSLVVFFVVIVVLGSAVVGGGKW